ncbi:fer-1-like protein 5 isoform X2 [Ornithorhynchus anatinus]|uniref:fer-1-like protein 5 isoform X2 n=1 Tax=Ornithorhynchus anatinus TaxID=9258 RepID=UPI0019D4887F|nr:fer-1-like protein 5 isoform X2 [Ornithorhynchus anatinus]
MLHLIVDSAKICPARSPPPSSCVTAYFRDVKKRTQVVGEDHNPFWNETLIWSLGPQPLDGDSFVEVLLRDLTPGIDDRLVGLATVLLGALAADPSSELVLTELPLLDRSLQPTQCTITLRVTCLPRPAPRWAGPEVSIVKSTADLPRRKSEVPGTAVQKTQAPKPQDFQVRVRIIEGRQFQGNDIKPVVKVLIGHHEYRTRIQRGNNPFFNEIFFQNFHQLASKLFDEYITVQALNSRALRSDSLLGMFQVEIGFVYHSPGHALLGKWLSLYQPNNLSAGVKGYLKVSLYVLGAGDQAPVEQTQPLEREDLEKSLFKPAALPDYLATLRIFIYRAEDLRPGRKPDLHPLWPSQKPKGKRSLLNPLVEVDVAGKILKTGAESETESPVWNQVLTYTVQLPFVINQIKLTVLDWHQERQRDVIGTACLLFDHISSSGTQIKGKFAGFPPCFGPSFLTLHCGSREAPNLQKPSKPSLLAAQGEVVSYCGRILVELTTSMETSLEKITATLSSKAASTLERQLARHKYGLCAIFLSSTMMPAFKGPVRFEVSIGHYGNKTDATYSPQASTTQSGQVVFDGNSYHYLPWADAKPVVAVTSFWEDVGYRMDALNVLHAIHTRLKTNLEALKAIRNPKDPQLPSLREKLLADVRADCRQPLPSLKGRAGATVLDQHLRQLRGLLLQELAQEAKAVGRGPLVPEAEGWLHRLGSVLPEPQVSVPDVVVWLLCRDRRVAFARVPAHTVMFSRAGPRACGRFCGKAQTLFLQYPEGQGQEGVVPAQLRVLMWLGRVADSEDFTRRCPGDIVVYAETYENQALLKGQWGLPDPRQCPAFSDVSGHLALPKTAFQPPRGWRWHKAWVVEPHRRLLLDTDTDRLQVMEEVYENQSREPGGLWAPAAIPNTNQSGEPVPSRRDLRCPQGWHVEGDWVVELNRAVDDAGWEYSTGTPSSVPPQAWHAAEKTYHSWRRRRWVRWRRRNSVGQSSEPEMASFLQLPSAGRPKETAAAAEKKEEKEEEEKEAEEEDDGDWQYGSLGSKLSRHPQPDSRFRRRCWRRRLLPVPPFSIAPVFLLEGSLDEQSLRPRGADTAKPEKEVEEAEGHEPQGEESAERRQEQQLSTPFIYCGVPEPHYYQLFCYIYQARDLQPTQSQSFSAPYVRVTFLHRSQRTRALQASLAPLWDQTLFFDRILLYGDPQDAQRDPPPLVLELWDRNPRGGDSLKGRGVWAPTVWLDLEARTPPALGWHLINRGPETGGAEILAASELVLESQGGEQRPPLFSVPRKDGYYTLPRSIQPVLRKSAIEILAWGLRNLKSYKLRQVRSPHLLVECGGQSLQTPPLRDLSSNPNFPQAALFLTLLLPEDEAYAPPLVLKVVDNQEFGYQPVVGQTTVRSLGAYFCNPWAEGYVPPRLPVPQGVRPRKFLSYLSGKNRQPLTCAEEETDDEEDWWSKLYWATGEHRKDRDHVKKDSDSLKVYDCELEAVPDFQGLQDFCQSFSLYRGEPHEDAPVVGEFKGLFRIYPLPEDPAAPRPPRQFQELPRSGLQKCLVRVYVVRAFNLQPKDRNSLCDPYVILKLGQQTVGSRDHYKPNTLDPTFGSMFELSCTIPLEKDLEVLLFDYDLMPPDPEIGATVIDLENRLLSGFGARCGLPSSYCLSGPCQWRDQLLPSRLLELFARRKGLPLPELSVQEDRIRFSGREFLLKNFEPKPPVTRHLGPPKERLALHLLRAQGLVPEHLETRTLYSSGQPGIDQGKLQMWVDIFPEQFGPPGPPVNITPRKPRSYRYELRCIIWNTCDMDLRDVSIMGEKMSDIYVKGWMQGQEKNPQKTDIHYRSLAGEGSFNWRFIFTLDYLPTERMCVQAQEFFWRLDPTLKKVPPRLILQVWDNDKFSADDFIGVLELDLSHLPVPSRSPQGCSASVPEAPGAKPGRQPPRFVSLFRQKQMRGWWPCLVEEEGKWRLSGKLELTLEILTEEEAAEKPAGRGQREPNQNPVLLPPVRPEVSFLWWAAPLRSLRYILWRRHRWRILILLFVILLSFLLVTFVYATPNYLAMKLINPISVVGSGGDVGAVASKETSRGPDDLRQPLGLQTRLSKDLEGPKAAPRPPGEIFPFLPTP